MTEILLFHHAQGQTRGFLAFADELRAAGHVVHAPDLYDGNTFTDLDEGVGYAKEIGFGTIAERGRLAADGLPNELVYAGFSLGACRRRCWPRPVRAPRERCSSALRSRPPSSAPGRRAFPSRST
jgi:hypothetical protein